MNPVAPLQTVSDIERLLEAHADLHALLLHVERLGLPDAWIGAGFIRNMVWDVLHGREINVSSLNDVDVVFLDYADDRKERDLSLEAALQEVAPGLPWQVRNQARMYRRNSDEPYPDTLHAVARFPETATAVAARTQRGRVEVVAPHGIEDLLNLIVRPTPAFEHKMDIYRKRVLSKNWPSRWPRLTMFMTWEEAYTPSHNSFARIDT